MCAWGSVSLAAVAGASPPAVLDPAQVPGPQRWPQRTKQLNKPVSDPSVGFLTYVLKKNGPVPATVNMVPASSNSDPPPCPPSVSNPLRGVDQEAFDGSVLILSSLSFMYHSNNRPSTDRTDWCAFQSHPGIKSRLLIHLERENAVCDL